MTSFKKSYGNSAFALKSWWCATASTAANKVGTSSTDAADHHILQAGQYSDLNIFDANNCLLIWNETAGKYFT